ncbi:MAG: DNA methyltransferase [Armatimonadota bacterium]|nr:MAG: DNA methyltransferase [Armatimonadota bacterium]
MLSLSWYGGKIYLVSELLKLIPRHRIYVEVFGGGAALLLNKRPSEVEVYNDINRHLVNLFRVLKNPEKFERFFRHLALTPHAREEHRYACAHYDDESLSDEERAALFYTAIYQSINAIPGSSWSRTTWESRRGMALKTSAWLGTVEGLPEIAERLIRVQIDCDHFSRIIRTYDTPETFFYCDPPYLPDTRVVSSAYQHEMSADDHIQLLEQLLAVQGKVMLSGYPNELYDRYLKDWERRDFQIHCRSRVGTPESRGLHHKPVRVERVWMNYDPEVSGVLRLDL